ncbi:MAG: endonuclease/exonuclease/phosphatase family protein [Deltaproteobacteria bacterium]|nr:endonuclease/exonuclease/phosphatase family protein [Deltaproteobacteria bacterium]
MLTLNCWNVIEPYEPRMELIRRGIEALRPDVVGLQEIIVRRDGFDQAARIFAGLGYRWEFGPAMRFNRDGSALPVDADGDAFGNVVASRWPIVRSRVHPLPGVESGERRSAIAAVIESPSGLLPFISTHLNWKYHHGVIRERQVVALVDFVGEWSLGVPLPPILVGDMNADPDSAEIRFLCGLQRLDGRSAYFQDAWRVTGNAGPGFTWDNRNTYAHLAFEPNRRIDYVFVGLGDGSGRGWIESARVVLDEPVGGVFPSDHFGMLAEVQI